jgi:hypothetical protein
MALSLSAATASVKTRMDIASSITTFDAQIQEFVTDAVNRLFPSAAKEVDAQSVVIAPDNYGEVIVDLTTLSTPLSAARSVEISAGYEWQATRQLYHHAGKLRIRGVSSNMLNARIYGLIPYVITTVPDNLAPAIYWYAMSEFYDYLAGNKRKYNLYAQAGGRQVDNMAAESTFYSDKADAYVNDHATVY